MNRNIWKLLIRRESRVSLQQVRHEWGRDLVFMTRAELRRYILVKTYKVFICPNVSQKSRQSISKIKRFIVFPPHSPTLRCVACQMTSRGRRERRALITSLRPPSFPPAGFQERTRCLRRDTLTRNTGRISRALFWGRTGSGRRVSSEPLDRVLGLHWGGLLPFKTRGCHSAGLQC